MTRRAPTVRELRQELADVRERATFGPNGVELTEERAAAIRKWDLGRELTLEEKCLLDEENDVTPPTQVPLKEYNR